MSYQISTEAYEGPIDLFYDLVVSDRINPSTLSLSRLVEGFLSDLAEGAPVDLEHLSEFVLVLALLCRLKARRMLGGPQDSEDEPVENPDRDLWNQLAHLTFGGAVAELAERLEGRSGLLSRQVGPDWSKMRTAPQLAFHLDPEGLAELAGEVLARAQAVPDLDHLALDLPTVEESMAELWRRVSRAVESSFEELSHYCCDRAEEAAWFMGLMELTRQGTVRISQAAPTADIVIRHDRSPARLVSAKSGPG